MASALSVNPTRMELTRIKKRLVTAKRGHKLLKDKRDEMVRQLILIIRENQQLRKEVEAELHVPTITVDESSLHETVQAYGFAETSSQLDGAIATLAELLPKMVRLAEIEKTCDMLADEIEKTRRRVNALEYVMIPQFEMTIREISMKLEENERGATTRLMKVKDMMAQREA